MPQGFCVQLPLRIFDNDGVPGAGFFVYTYETNSTTPKDTYSDGQLSSLNTNPVECDTYGFCRIFIAQGETIKLVVHDADDVLQYSFDYQQPMIADPSAGSLTAVPTGGMIVWPDPSHIPTGFLLADGSAVLRASYEDLDAVYAACTPAYPYGAGDGSTTMNLPDMRGRFPLAQAASGTGDTIGDTGGELDHTHTGPSHTHVTTVPRDGWGHASNIPATSGRIRTGDASGTGTEASAEQATADQDVTSAAGGTGDTGAANPAYLVVGCWIVKT